MALLVCLLLPFLVFSQTDCPNAPASPADRRTDTTRLRAGTFNAEWLFPGNDGQSPWTTTAQAEQHLIEVAAAIAKQNPDILSLQEVKDCTMLVRLINQLETVHKLTGYKPYMIKGTDTATGQNVGFISRIDPTSAVTRTEARYSYPIAGNACKSTSSGTSGVSKHYRAQFTINGKPITMFGQHFLAFPTDPARCVQREAQASVMRQYIEPEINANRDVIVFGDYNDYSDKVLDSSNDVPTSRVMTILRDGLVGAFNLSTGVDAVPLNLYEPSQNIVKSERYTNAYNTADLSMIDHLLVSQSIYNNIFNTFIAHDYPRQTVSDHWPYYIDIKTPWL